MGGSGSVHGAEIYNHAFLSSLGELRETKPQFELFAQQRLLEKELQRWRVSEGPESQVEPSLRHLPGLDAFPSILVDVQTWPSESRSITRTFPPRQRNRRQECTRATLLGSCSQEKLVWHPLGRGVQAPTLNPLLALAPQPVGLCLYLVTLGGFASSTGIWHWRWKISLVRSPWKQAEPLRRFTLNGVHPACISCPMCLEFPPRPLEPLSRPGALLQ